MSLQFVIGSPGSGKSTTIYNRIIKESIDNPRRKYIIVVPEQFTMLTQKELTSLHPNHVIMNIDVLSFNRLAYRVFEELGIETLDVLEETGKNLAIRKIAMDHQEELSVLNNNINKKGYISEIKSFVLELAQYNISADVFLSVIEDGDFSPHFIKKAKDIQVIYKEYEEFIKDRYITAESLLVRLNEVIADSKYCTDSVFVFDGFTGFTPLQNEILKTILPRINKAYVVVTMDTREPLYGNYKEYELFYMSKKMIARAKQICDLKHVDIEEESISCEVDYRHEDQGYISYINKHLFRNPVVEGEEQDEVDLELFNDELSIHSLSNPKQEIEYVATQIAKDVREKGIRYRDIAVCAANLADIKDYMGNVFSKYNIPYYLDLNNTITFHPALEFIKSAFIVQSTNYSYDSIIQLLRCNLTGISMDEVDRFDNYLKATRIRGVNSYRKDFTYEPDSFVDQLDIINDIRARFVEPIITFTESIKAETNAETKAGAIYRLLCDYQVEDKINRRVELLEQSGDNVKASEYSQVYGIIISILDKIVTLLGNEVITPKDYSDVLLSSCEAAQVATIPMSSDQVVIGDLERTRYDHPKVMYFIGVNDGIIPSAGGSKGIISQSERMALKDALSKKDIELAPTDLEKTLMQRFYVYMILTKASDKLCITYSSRDIDANAIDKSYIVDELLSLFSDISVDVIDNISPSDYIVTPDSTKRFVASDIRQFVHSDDECMDNVDAMLGLLSFANKNHYSYYNNILKGAFYYHTEETIDRELYDMLINAEYPLGSVSRLESYRKCAYNYFLNYCLKVREREEGRLGFLDYGSIYHDIIEGFSESLKKENIKWSDVDDEKRIEILEKTCDIVFSNYNRTDLLDTPKDSYVLDKIKITMNKTVENLVAQAKHTKFEPYGFEIELKEIASREDLIVELRDGRKMNLSGRIDRLDTYEEDGITYVKIIDYKSGNNSVDYEKIYNGLQLQLIYYLDTAVKGFNHNHSAKPAGIFYYKIQDPIVKYVEGSIDELIAKEMMPKGVFFEDVDEDKCESYKQSKDYNEDISYDALKTLKQNVAKALDTDCDGKSLYAPINYTKSGEFSGIGTNALSVNDAKRLSNHTLGVIKELGSNMYEGIIDAKPIKDESCKYCPYKSVCGFDVKQPGYDYCDYTKLGRDKKQEIFDLID